MKLSFTYTALPKNLFSEVNPKKFQDPQLILYNKNLSNTLGIQHENMTTNYLVETLLGYHLPENHRPIAQAYSGHQYGNFTTLGDGRAMLLGEIISRTGERFDVHLKGSGQTPYSRNADGNATLSTMLREYIISEAMSALRIPTSRSLAVIDTGEIVCRQHPEHGAILVRVAPSHIRFGTFEYARRDGNLGTIQSLLEHTIQRHYPELINSENTALALLDAVMRRQAELITEWMRVGFIHGVMNTDNMTVSGDTIDYGPCSFMNRYDLQTVFSSIDKNGRYSYGNQPYICKWNLARFAESLLPLLSNDHKQAVALAEKTIEQFDSIYEIKWLNMMANKLGLVNVKSADKDLIFDLLSIMHRNSLDYTNTFYGLTYDLSSLEKEKKSDIDAWLLQWKKRLATSKNSIDSAQMHMKNYNPVIIPRNHLVESALKSSQNGNLDPAMSLASVLREPYQLLKNIEQYQTVPPNFDDDFQTFCGT